MVVDTVSRMALNGKVLLSRLDARGLPIKPVAEQYVRYKAIRSAYTRSVFADRSRARSAAK
jgi:hypothetical protein